MLRCSSVKLSPLYREYPHLTRAINRTSTWNSLLARQLCALTSLSRQPGSPQYHFAKDMHISKIVLPGCNPNRYYTTNSQNILQIKPGFLSCNLSHNRYLRGRPRQSPDVVTTVGNLPERYRKAQDSVVSYSKAEDSIETHSHAEQDVIPIVNQTVPTVRPQPPDEDSKIAKDLYAWISHPETDPLYLLDEVSNVV